MVVEFFRLMERKAGGESDFLDGGGGDSLSPSPATVRLSDHTDRAEGGVDEPLESRNRELGCSAKKDFHWMGAPLSTGEALPPARQSGGSHSIPNFCILRRRFLRLTPRKFAVSPLRQRLRSSAERMTRFSIF